MLDIARQIREHSDVPLLLFTYMNPVDALRLAALARDAAAAGIDGCLLTDMSVEEAEPYIGAMREHNLDTVFLAAPTSTRRRLELVAKYSSGFVYLVSRTGVTGEQQNLSQSALPLIERMRQVTDLPLAMGFGIATRQHVSEVGAVADGVVVGSAIVRTIEKHGASPELEQNLETVHAGSCGGSQTEECVTHEAAVEKLAECRRNIDRIDVQLLALLNERARVVEIIGTVKRDQAMPVYEPKREDQVYHECARQ